MDKEKIILLYNIGFLANFFSSVNNVIFLDISCLAGMQVTLREVLNTASSL